jgi:hypothetical protein
VLHSFDEGCKADACLCIAPVLCCMFVCAPPGIVRSTKMTRTIVVRRDYLHYIKKYAR